MTMLQNLWPKANRNNDSLHRELVTAVMDILKHQRAEGATTGLMMTRIQETNPSLAKRIVKRSATSFDRERIQYFKTVLGHALDEWQALGQVHCDQNGKRIMDGDERSVPVWRTQEDWVAFAKAGKWMLKEHRKNGLPEYSERLRNYLKTWTPSPKNQTT